MHNVSQGRIHSGRRNVTTSMGGLTLTAPTSHIISFNNQLSKLRLRPHSALVCETDESVHWRIFWPNSPSPQQIYIHSLQCSLIEFSSLKVNQRWKPINHMELKGLNRRSHTQKISLQMVNPRNMAGERRSRRRRDGSTQTIFFFFFFLVPIVPISRLRQKLQIRLDTLSCLSLLTLDQPVLKRNL